MLDNTEDIIIKVLRAVPEMEKGESKDFDCPLCGQEKAMNASKCGFAMGS